MRQRFSRSIHDEVGAVSFLSVLVFMIIIVTVTLAYMQSVTRQQRTALNYDLGNRAYYAAEAGVQDTIRAIRAGLITGTKDYCLGDPLGGGLSDAFGGDAQIGGHGDYGLSFTCQLVDTSTISGTLMPGENNITMRIKPLSGSLPDPVRLTVSWGVPAEGVSDPTTYWRRGGRYRYFAPTNQWNRGAQLDGVDDAQPVLPLLRAMMITHPSSGNFQRADVRQRVAFLSPAGTGSKPNSAAFNMRAGLSSQQSQIVTHAACDNSAYAGNLNACQITLQISNHEGEVYLNLASFYRQASFNVTASNDAGEQISLANTMATIDVTAKAGEEVFRRVRQTISLGNNYRVHNGPGGAALIVGDGICKAFSINDTPTGFSSGCTP